MFRRQLYQVFGLRFSLHLWFLTFKITLKLLFLYKFRQGKIQTIKYSVGYLKCLKYMPMILKQIMAFRISLGLKIKKFAPELPRKSLQSTKLFITELFLATFAKTVFSSFCPCQSPPFDS